MAIFKTISSGSTGNCYVLECSEESIIIELGVSWKEILRGIDYDLKKVKGCLVSHLHLDHSKSIKNAIASGLDVFSCNEVATIHPSAKVLEKRKKTEIGGFKVQPIPLEHSCECYGFLIEHDEFGRLVFCTDCKKIPYRFKKINHFIVESNYSKDLIIEHMCDDKFNASASENHLEINDTLEFLINNYSSEAMNVLLIHLSSGNADGNLFTTMVKEQTAISNVSYARPNHVLELMKEEF